MKLIPNNTIQVYNYSPNPVAIKGTHREYLVPGARGMGPGIEFLSTEDVKYIERPILHYHWTLHLEWNYIPYHH